MQANETTTTPLNEDVVRTRAYLMWEADGRPFGREDHYWHLAMSEITTGAAGDRPRRAAAASAVAEKTAKSKAAEKKATGGKAKKKS
jgi:hypothetical protein